MDESDKLGIGMRTTVMNNADASRCPDTLTLPENDCPVDMESLDIKPELLDLSESKPAGHQATKACQTEITLCDEFWNVCMS